MIDLDVRLSTGDPSARDELVERYASAFGSRQRVLSNIGRTCDPAHDPQDDISAAARAVLLDLYDRDGSAGDAAIRLPIHQFTRDELTRLVDIVECRVNLFEREDAFMVPVSRRTIQETIALKTVVLQAMDAAQLWCP